MLSEVQEVLIVGTVAPLTVSCQAVLSPITAQIQYHFIYLNVLYYKAVQRFNSHGNFIME